MSVSVSTTNNPVTVTASGTSASVTVAGGFGPQGLSGVSAISQASDVSFSTPTDGDVIRYSSGKWRNYPDTNLVDGGNF
jgi:hypothetical protein